MALSARFSITRRSFFPVGHGYRHVRIGLRGKAQYPYWRLLVERLFNESKQVNKVYWLDEQLVAVGFGFRDGENVILPN